MPTTGTPENHQIISVDQQTSLAELLGNTEPNRGDATWILATLLPLVHEATPDNHDGHEQARRALSLILHHDLNAIEFDKAMEACSDLAKLRAGECLMFLYGVPNTADNRADWTDYETRQLNDSIGKLVAGIRERVPA